MLLQLEPLAGTRTPIAVGTSGIYFYGPARTVGEEGISRQYCIWFRLIDEQGQPTVAGGKVRIKFTIADSCFGYLAPKAEDDFSGEVAAVQALRSETDGEWAYIFAYPLPLVLAPEWFVRYKLQVWFQPEGHETILYRETEGTLDTQA